MRDLIDVCLDERWRFCADTIILPRCLVGYYVQMVSIAFFLFFSDIFITLRCVVLTRTT